jgi:4'-phosphopantetheinyl transferase
MTSGQAVRFLHQLDSRHSGVDPHVWILDLDRPGGTAPDHGGEFQSESPGAPIDEKLVRRRRQEMSRRLTLRVIADVVGVPQSQLELTTDAHGRPSVARDTVLEAKRHLLPDFSVAHSENVFAIGVTFVGRIGVDVELLRPRTETPTPPNDLLTALEKDWIRTIPPDDRPLALLCAWTAKEAMVKAVGHGAAFGIERVETAPLPDGSLRIARLGDSERIAEGWDLVHQVVAVGGTPAIVAVVTSAS